MVCLPRGKNSKERSVETHKPEKVENFKLFVIKQRATGFGICPAESHSCFVQYVLTTLLSFLLSHQSCKMGRVTNSIILLRKQPCGACIPSKRSFPSCLKFPLVKSCGLR